MANRYSNKKQPSLPTVENIELEEKVNYKMIAVFILMIVIAVASFGIAINNLLKPEGWTIVDATSDSFNCMDSFEFSYYFDSGVTKRSVMDIYRSSCENVYQMFDESQEYEGINNVYTLNHNVNKKMLVDEYLYNSLKMVEESGTRYIYQGPIFDYYDNLYFVGEESARLFDPLTNEDVATYFEQISKFNKDDIYIEFFDDGTVKLNVSDEYMKFAKENEINNYIDFYYLKTVFEIDYIADKMIEAGFNNGCISSYNGMIRNLGSDEKFGINIYADIDNIIERVGVYEYSGKLSMVTFKNYQFSTKEDYDFVWINDTYRHKFLNEKGIPQSSYNEMYVYHTNIKCSKLLLDNLNKYMNNEGDFMHNWIVMSGNRIVTNQKNLVLKDGFTYE